MSRRFPALIALVCIVMLATYASSTSRRMYRENSPFADQATMIGKLKSDPAIVAEVRFGAIRDILPGDAWVGYFGQSDEAFGETSWWGNILRYTLAPRVVVTNEEPALLIANYPDENALARAIEERTRAGKRYHVVARPANVPGVAIVENEGAKR